MFSRDIHEYIDSISKKRLSKRDEKLREEMVREYYRYFLLLNPPDIDT